RHVLGRPRLEGAPGALPPLPREAVRAARVRRRRRRRRGLRQPAPDLGRPPPPLQDGDLLPGLRLDQRLPDPELPGEPRRPRRLAPPQPNPPLRRRPPAPAAAPARRPAADHLEDALALLLLHLLLRLRLGLRRDDGGGYGGLVPVGDERSDARVAGQ